MSLPWMVRQKIRHLRSRIEASTLEIDAAAVELLADLREKYPSLIESVLITWCEARLGRRSNPLPAGWVQAELFPPKFGKLTPLSDLELYIKEQSALTGRFKERDDARQLYFKELSEAAGGDLTMTWEDAQNRLGA